MAKKKTVRPARRDAERRLRQPEAFQACFTAWLSSLRAAATATTSGRLVGTVDWPVSFRPHATNDVAASAGAWRHIKKVARNARKLRRERVGRSFIRGRSYHASAVDQNPVAICSDRSSGGAPPEFVGLPPSSSALMSAGRGASKRFVAGLIDLQNAGDRPELPRAIQQARGKSVERNLFPAR